VDLSTIAGKHCQLRRGVVFFEKRSCKTAQSLDEPSALKNPQRTSPRMGLPASPRELAPRSPSCKESRGVEVLPPRAFGTVPTPHPAFREALLVSVRLQLGIEVYQVYLPVHYVQPISNELDLLFREDPVLFHILTPLSKAILPT